jgi:hypothetical protein
MFFEPTQFPGVVPILGGIINDLGFSEAPGGFKNRQAHVLNEHSYCC